MEKGRKFSKEIVCFSKNKKLYLLRWRIASEPFPIPQAKK